MLDALDGMSLGEIRRLFLSEMKELLDAMDVETPEQIRERKQRVKIIDEVLEAKKKLRTRDLA